MTALLILLATAAVSSAGSLQLGAVNSAVIQVTLEERRGNGLWTALGGSIPEILYSAGALGLENAVWAGKPLWDGWYALAALVLIGLGVHSWRRGVGKLQDTRRRWHLPPLARGFVLGMSNPQLLPFWLFILVQWRLYFTFEGIWPQVAFVAGAFLGAWFILSLLSYWTDRYKARILERLSLPLLHQITGLFFILLGILQGFKIIGK